MGAGGLRGELVGRDREVGLLALALDAAARGHGGLVTIGGEAGIGKTRLAEEAVALAGERGFRTVWGAGWTDGGSPALWPWQDVLERLGRTDALGGAGDRDAGDAEGERFARFRAVARAVVEETDAGPLLVVLDDAQAMDAGALLLTRFVVRSVRDAAVLLVATARTEDGDDDAADARAELEHEGTVIELRGLDDGTLAGLLEASGRKADDAATRVLRDLTGGNPLLVHEALARGDEPEPAVPDRVRRLLRTRLRPFGPGERAILSAIAVLGPLADDRRVAVVAGGTEADARRTRIRAAAAGLLRTAEGPASFSHGLLRDALLGSLPAADLAALHGRSADVLAAGADVDGRLGRIALHRLAAATDAASRALAVAACRTAAAADHARGAYETAARLLRSACDLLDADDGAPPELLLELAQAELAAGRLRAARVAFRQVVARHDPDTDPAIVAEAALGLGGIWVFEHRTPEDIDVFHRLLERAAKGLGDRRPDLQARIAVRLATEAVYLGTGTVDEARLAVAHSRATGDPLAIAEGLSLLHHVLLGPQFEAERTALADEVIDVATRSGNAVLALMGTMWRTVDRLLSGHRSAARSLGELRLRADALQVHAISYVVDLVDVMVAQRMGHLAAAEERAERALARGVEVGDADAPAFYGAQLLAIRWLQRRSAEMVSLAQEASASPAVVANDRSFLAALAALAADAGEDHRDLARQALADVLADGLDALPASSSWLVSLFCIVEAAVALADAPVAAVAYDALLPYAGRPVMPSLALACLGPVDRVLGLAAHACGREADVVPHLEAALEVSRRLGNQPFLALGRVELGAALASHGAPGAEALLAEGRAGLAALGLAERGERSAELLGAPAVEPRAAAGGADAGDGGIGVLRFTGSSWEVVAGEERAVVADAVGVRYLARLLAAPGQEVGADELAGLGVAAARQPTLDATAISAYRARIRDLQEQLDRADAAGDADRSERARSELDQLLDHVGAEMGLGGRARSFADERERARTAVQKAIRRAIDRIAAAAPELGGGLVQAVRTGSVCCYEPVAGLPRRWDVTPPA